MQATETRFDLQLFKKNKVVRAISGTEKTSFWHAYESEFCIEEKRAWKKLINALENVLKQKKNTHQMVAVIKRRNMCKKTTAKLIWFCLKYVIPA